MPEKRAWIGWSFVAGCCAAIPAGVMLAYVAAIPFYLGLFFFLLLGLLIGATMFRCGRRAMPVHRPTLLLIGSVVVLLTWGTTLVTEYATFPELVARRTEAALVRRLTPAQRAEIAAKSREQVLSALLGRPYKGGVADWLAGFPRYLKWVARDGDMECPTILDTATFTLTAGQSKVSWAFRIVLSMALLAFSILSQYLLLARQDKVKNPPDGEPSEEGR